MSKLGTGLSLAKLAEHKKLPSDFLAKLGVNDHLGGVAIRYFDDAGDEIAVKRRTDIVARNGSYWPGGTKLAAYGLWKIHEARKVGFVLLVEGESDCWALWHHGLPTLGLPGSGTAQTLTAEALSGIETIYVHREPDRGGELFVANVAARLRQLQFAGRAFEIQMPDRLKDPADLHKDNPERFKERMETVILKSKPLLLGNTNRKPAEPTVEEPPAAEVIRLSKVAPDKTHWLWQYRIPRGALTVLEGDPGLGKSTLTAELAARVTRGESLGDGGPPGESAGVLFLNAEDSPSRTLLPRLAAAGADLDRVIFVDTIREDGIPRPVGLPGDIDLIAQIVKQHNIALVVIDPLMAYLEGRVNAHKDQDVRRALYPLKQLAERHDVAVIIVRHLTKQTAGAGLYRGGGSIGIIGAARAALVLGRDPGEETRRILAMNKSNLGPVATSLAFTLEDHEEGVARVVWCGTSTLSAADVLATSGRTAAPVPTKVEACVAALREFLAFGPRPVTELEEHLKRGGFSEYAIKEARKAAGVVAKLIGSGAAGHWQASLPNGGTDAELAELLRTP